MLNDVTNVFYFVDDLTAAHSWYGTLLGTEPVEVQPQLVTYLVDNTRLTLHLGDKFNTPAHARGTVAYWGVDDVDVVVAWCVARGAIAHRGRRRSSPANGYVSFSTRSATYSGSAGADLVAADPTQLRTADQVPDHVRHGHRHGPESKLSSSRSQ